MSKKSARVHIRMEPDQLEFARGVARILGITVSKVLREKVSVFQFFGAKATAEVIRNVRADAQPPANKGDLDG